MMMLMVPHANCNSKLEVEVEVAAVAEGEAGREGRWEECSFVKLIKTTHLVEQRANTPVGHVATPEHIHVRWSQTEPIKSFPVCCVGYGLMPQQS